MLSRRDPMCGPGQRLDRRPNRRRQHGVVLMIALIMLIAMTLGGIALIRAVYTSSLIAGNMAFRQSATYSADAGVEAAITWLENHNSGATLHANSNADGYAASRQDPGATQSWDDFWAVLVAANQVATLAAADASGNTISYAIQRLCNAAGDPASGVGCTISPLSTGAGGNSRGAGVVQMQAGEQVYYRITSKVVGPRRTVSYVQAVVSM